MKRLFLLLIILFLYSQVFSQGKLTFFSQDGKKFWVIINGKKINEEPQFNVSDIPVDFQWGKARIIFEDEKIKPIDKNVQAVDDNNWLHVKYMIKNRKGKYIINDFGSSFEILGPIAGNQNNSPSQTNNQQSVNNIPQPETPAQPQQTNNQNNTALNNQNTPVTSQNSTNQPNHYEMPGYHGKIGCPWPMQASDFQESKNSITSKKFDDTRLTIAKQITSANCLLCSQVKEIMLLFTFEDSRLEYAKYAYDYVFDISNYFRLNDAFTFESTIEELNNYISNKK